MNLYSPMIALVSYTSFGTESLNLMPFQVAHVMKFLLVYLLCHCSLIV
jgi:hypothetical protein